MNNRIQTVLNAFKNEALAKYLVPMADKPFGLSWSGKQKKCERPFEVYQYQESEQIQNSYEALEDKIRQQILYKFNQFLFQQQSSELQIQLFALDQSIQIQNNQIAFLQIQIQNQTSNHNMQYTHLESKIKTKHNNTIKTLNQQAEITNKQENKKKYSVNSRLKIYSSLNCQIQGQQTGKRIEMKNQSNSIQNKQQVKLNLDQLKTYQLKTINQNKKQQNPQDQTINNTYLTQKAQFKNYIANLKQEQQKRARKFEEEINFYERVWRNAKKQNKKKLARDYKLRIFERLSQFWQLLRQ